MLLNALQVQLKKDMDQDEKSDVEKFKWDVVDFDTDFLWL